MVNTPPTPAIRQRFGHEGLVDRVSGLDFFFPGFHAGVGDSWVAQGLPDAGKPLADSRVWHAVTPGTRHTTHYFFAMGSNDRDGVEFMVDYLKPVIAEDVFATEAIEKIISTMDEVPTELMLRSDTTAVMGRRVLQAMMDAEAAAQPLAP